MRLTPETLACLCCSSLDEAYQLVASIRERRRDGVLEHVIRALEALPAQRGTFADLDSMLRPDVTMKRIIHPRAAAESAVKRACLLTALQCLTARNRVVYVLRDIFDCRATAIAVVLGISHTVVAIRVRRARKQLANHYAARCVHLHPSNRCSCRGRVGSAVAAGLIRLPILRLPNRTHNAKPAKSVAELIRGLPLPFVSR